MHPAIPSIGAAALLLAGCGLPQPPITAQGLAQQGFNAAASGYEVIFRFNGHADGRRPTGPLLNVGGTLYGTTSAGGTGPCRHGCGTLYGLTPKGLSSLFSFTPASGTSPDSGLIDVNGTLYGTTPGGGQSDYGTVYGITTAGAETMLYSFKGGADGLFPHSGLIDVKGKLYGTTDNGGGSFGLGTVFTITPGGTEKVLHSFERGPGGFEPLGGLVYIDGLLYGTTFYGGNGTGCTSSAFATCGTFYSLSLSGKFKVLYNFGGGGDGAGPRGDLIDVNGTLYGVTQQGGNGCGDNGCGTVYSMTTSGAERVLYRFSSGEDGISPMAGLVNVRGTLYGTTPLGGDFTCGRVSQYGCGTIYSVTTSGAESVLYRFSGESDGSNPMASLTEMHGSLYGTTAYGGEPQRVGKTCCGTIFRFTP